MDGRPFRPLLTDSDQSDEDAEHEDKAGDEEAEGKVGVFHRKGPQGRDPEESYEPQSENQLNWRLSIQCLLPRNVLVFT